ncbi:MAG: hypothetical protein WCV82_01060 [Candidatus Paceibacterota bacterium]
MLTPYVNSRFVEKVFTDLAGRQFKLVFFVALVDGEVKGRLVSAEPVIRTFRSECVACLPALTPENKTETEYAPSFTPVASPYFSLEYLLSSQPTRAPSK